MIVAFVSDDSVHAGQIKVFRMISKGTYPPWAARRQWMIDATKTHAYGHNETQ